MFSRRERRRSHREWVLWGVPLGMITIAGVLIASTQRQADYALSLIHISEPTRP